MDHAAFLEAQLAAVRARVSHAVVTILSTQGATPRTSGKLLVTEQGAAAGTIGGLAMSILGIFLYLPLFTLKKQP